jgi:hypothetical protein
LQLHSAYGSRSDESDLFSIGRVVLTTIIADAPNETLRQHRFDRSGD